MFCHASWDLNARMTLGSGLPIMKEREAIEEAESLHLGLLSSRDGFKFHCTAFVKKELVKLDRLVWSELG
jgi:hypothetical protein